MKRVQAFLVLCAVLTLVAATGGMARADYISPSSYSNTIAVGSSVTFTKTVTVSAGTPTAAQGDVFFLCDTTGSMTSAISSVKGNVSNIVTGLSAYGNIATGAGSYRDFYDSSKYWGSSGDYAYRRDAAISPVVATTQAGINSWSANGGADTPEASLYALTQAVGTSTGWRAGSEKFVLWFGDAPGHEPSNTTGYPGPSTADTIAALQTAGVTVFAFDVTTSSWQSLNDYGQAAAITSATGGTLTTGLGTNVVDTIVGAIGSGFEHYSSVGITAPTLAGLGITITPEDVTTGTFDRSTEKTFKFKVKIDGLAPGTYDFNMFGTVDGGNIGTETDHIVVTGTAVPEPATLLFLGLGLIGVAGLRRKMKK